MTVFSARQMINHGHIKVNKKKVNISSYLVKDSDLIEISDKSKKLTFIDGSLQSKKEMCPIEDATKKYSGQVVRLSLLSAQYKHRKGWNSWSFDGVCRI